MPGSFEDWRECAQKNRARGGVPVTAASVGETLAPPGPRGSFLLGMLRELQRDQLGTLERVASRHGDVVGLDVGPPGRRRRLYLVSHPDGIQRVLASASDGYVKGTPIQREMAAVFGDGLLTSVGQPWLQQRRTLAPLFTPRRVNEYVSTMADEAVTMVNRWIARPSGRVDLHEEMTTYALRVIGLALFGDDLDEVSSTVRHNLPVLSAYALRRGLSPVRLPAHWRTVEQRRATDAQRSLFGAVDAIVRDRRRAGGDGTDLVSLLLTVRDPQTGAPLTDREVRDQALLFMLAGHETTATALTFTCYLLGRDEDVQRRVRDEVDSVLPAASASSAPPVTRTEDVSKLRYTTMVVKEAMRLYPPAHSFARIVTTDDNIGGYRIPAGSTVFVSPWVTHRRADLWPDPLRFDPERFDPEASGERHRYAYFPFGGGPRSCIGNHFALNEAIVATAVIVAACHLRTDPDPGGLATGVTLRPGGQVPCQVSPRP